jgi:hypothetical protein
MDPLEAEAVAIYRQYRFLLPGRVLGLLRAISERLEWTTLLQELPPKN